MRKSIITTAAVASLLLCGCIKQDIAPAFQVSEHRISLTTDYSVLVDANISEGGQTRASYDDITAGDLSNDGIGIYCVPARKINSNATNFSWNKFIEADGSNVTNAHGVYWDNVRFKVGTDQLNKDGIPYYNLEMTDTNRPAFEYYPLTSNYGYDFYGYAPYKAGKKEDTENHLYYTTDISVVFDINGTQDIIHGKSKTPADSVRGDYYSARYFRKAGIASAVDMDFTHKLVRLNFNVKPVSDPVGSYESVNSLAVKSIKLINTVNKVRLYVAVQNGSTVATTGQLVRRGNGNDTGTFSLYAKEGNSWIVPDKLLDINSEDVNEAGYQPVGTHMMVFPEAQYTMEVILCDKDDIEKEYPSRTLTLNLQNGAFLSGHQYNINLSIEGPTAINLISAQLIEWQDGGDVDINYFDN